MHADRNRRRSPESGIRLKACRVINSIDARFSTAPEIAIQRGPKSGADVVAQMPFECSHWFLRLNVCAGRKLISGKKVVIVGKKDDPTVCVYDPVSPALGDAELWFEHPPVPSWVDELGRIILAGRSDYLEARAYEGSLLPLTELRSRKSRSALEIYGEPKDRVYQTGSIGIVLCADYLAAEVAYRIRKRGGGVCRAT